MNQLLNKFKDPELGRNILKRIREIDVSNVVIMEVCGTHTAAISRLAIRDLLKEKIDLRSGPGCPVCVTTSSDIDHIIEYAGFPGTILATFGDMMRVPGSRTSLAEEKSGGADIRVVYSPLDALRLAMENPDKDVIFLGVGFETTAPVVALALERALAQKINNFSIFSAHKLTPPAVEALLQEKEINIKGFLCPGHVSAVIGRRAWDFLGSKYGIPAVIAGFEANDVLGALEILLNMIKKGEARVVNGYTRAVKEKGNSNAWSMVKKYFDVVPAYWRGLGLIPESGLEIKEEYAHFDAKKRYPVSLPLELSSPRGCICGEILKGNKIPPECPLFGKACTPEKPVGPCMVSGEGACAAYYKYDRRGGNI